MRFGLLAAATLLAGATLSGPSIAATYTVGVEDIEYFPQYTVQNGEFKGFGRAVLDAFAQAKGHVFTYQPRPVARLFSEFVAGGPDLKYPDNAYWSADLKKGQTVVYSAPVVEYIDGVNVPPAAKGKGVDGIKTLGIVRGFTAWEWLDRIKAGALEVHENNSFTALLQQAAAGRVDGAYGNVAVVNHQLAEMKKPDALVFDPGLPHTRSHYHLSSIKHPELIEEFNAWLAANGDLVAKLKSDYAVEQGVR